jgi:hypothetical protein
MKTVERARYKDREIFQVRKITFEPYRYSANNMSLVMSMIKKHLTPDLLTPKYREENKTNSLYGHCYHSTQALYYLMDTDCLVPMCGKDYRGDYHWWLQDEDKIYDVTAGQYYSVGKLPPYENGKPTKWYGWKQRPHQRSLDLMVRVLGKDNVTDERLDFSNWAP